MIELPSGVLGTLASVGLRGVIAGFLLLSSCLVGWQLSGPLAARSHERMSLFVQRTVTGTSPGATLTGGELVKRAIRGFFPSVRRLTIWALSSLASLTLVLVPAIAPLLVLIAQTAISAFFLAHAAIADNRDRLGLPSRLLLREPALLGGYALFPPAMLFVSGPIAVGGALVAVGAHRRRVEGRLADQELGLGA